MSIELTISIGYHRKRPDTQGDRWEARFDSIGLMVAGAIVTAIILLIVLPHVLAMFGS